MERKHVEKKKPEKQVRLKQYLVSGAPPGAARIRKAALIVHTCPKLANEEFTRKFPDCSIRSTFLVAESNLAKEDTEGRDFWAENRDWLLIDRESDDII